METITRDLYLNQLKAFKDKKLIKVITGIRRCGKSTLLDLFGQYLMDSGVTEEQIIRINFEDYDYIDLRDPKKLYQYVKKRLVPKRKIYVFFDEIQHVTDFPDVVNSLHIKPNVDVYVTGSNAYMLSHEIATLMSGRYVEIAMLPLSFKEYVTGTGGRENLSQKYADYIAFSSFPYALEIEGESERLDYLSGIYSTIVLKDIVSRYKVADVTMLESVVRFAADNIGNILSTKRIADTMTSAGRKMDVKTVEKFLAYLQESFVLYKADRYNIKGMQYLKTLEKYYLVDMGLRRLLLGSRNFDAGRILENIVYLELIRRKYKVYVGKIDSLEVDFVAMGNKGPVYYQVAATVRDEATLKRELASLQKINDQYPKYLLTLDEDPDADYNGIRRINVLQWLVE
ncbi:MAG: ATP-binding protein [Bacteroidales bacterium]|nr:ATP-binding protein [Bacteroidales bacterium]